jgi:hypothetical protein
MTNMIINVYLFDSDHNRTTLDKATKLHIQIDHPSFMEMVKNFGTAIGKALSKKDENP